MLYVGQFSEKLKGSKQEDVVILGLVVGMQSRTLPVGWAAKRTSEKCGGKSLEQSPADQSISGSQQPCWEPAAVPGPFAEELQRRGPAQFSVCRIVFQGRDARSGSCVLPVSRGSGSTLLPPPGNTPGAIPSPSHVSASSEEASLLSSSPSTCCREGIRLYLT